jgi:hypothetical protein
LIGVHFGVPVLASASILASILASVLASASILAFCRWSPGPNLFTSGLF